MTKAIQKLIEWQASDPKRHGWSIHQYDEIVRIQMRNEPFRCDQEVTTRTVQQAKCDVLLAEVELAIAKLETAQGVLVSADAVNPVVFRIPWSYLPKGIPLGYKRKTYSRNAS